MIIFLIPVTFMCLVALAVAFYHHFLPEDTEEHFLWFRQIDPRTRRPLPRKKP